MSDLNLYIGMFDNFDLVDEDGDDLICRFTLVVQAENIERAEAMFAAYMDEHQNDEDNPIVGAVYETAIVQIGPGAKIPTPVRFGQSTLSVDDDVALAPSPDSELLDPLITAYAPDAKEGEERVPFWETVTEDDGVEDDDGVDDDDGEEPDDDGVEDDEDPEEPDPKTGGPKPSMN